MYVVPPPQRSDPGSGSADLRVYQAWKGSNVCYTLSFSFPIFLHFFYIFIFVRKYGFILEFTFFRVLF
jgi:hypothetical protein